MGDKGWVSHPSSGRNHLCDLRNISHHHSHTYASISLKRKVIALPLGGWPPVTFPSLVSFSVFTPQPFSDLILFQEIISEHHAPAIAFFPSPAALLSSGDNISNKPQTIKLTHFSFAKSHFLSTRPRSKLWTLFPMWYVGSLKTAEKSLDGSYSKSHATSILSFITNASLPRSFSCCLWDSVQAYLASPLRFRFHRYSLGTYHMPDFLKYHPYNQPYEIGIIIPIPPRRKQRFSNVK